MAKSSLTEWLKTHTTRLRTIDPAAPLDVGAIGEGSHFVREFNLLRKRLLRFLNERCGVRVFAFEFGFSKAFAVDHWTQGSGKEEDLAHVSETARAGGAGVMLRSLCRRNRNATQPLRFVGVDIPEAGGSLLPALAPVASKSGASAARLWAKLPLSEQDAMTSVLARLLLRTEALEPTYVSRSDQERYDTAPQRMNGATHTDYMFRAMNGLFTGAGITGDLPVRDRFMAASLDWHVGQYLHRAHGLDYVALALTSTTDHTVDMGLDPDSPFGFTDFDKPLDPPETGSIEAAVIDAGLASRIRTKGAYMRTAVAEAFNAVLVVHAMTRQADGRFS